MGLNEKVQQWLVARDVRVLPKEVEDQVNILEPDYGNMTWEDVQKMASPVEKAQWQAIWDVAGEITQFDGVFIDGKFDNSSFADQVLAAGTRWFVDRHNDQSPRYRFDIRFDIGHETDEDPSSVPTKCGIYLCPESGDLTLNELGTTTANLRGHLTDTVGTWYGDWKF